MKPDDILYFIQETNIDKKDIGFLQGQEPPTITDEALADAYDTKAEAWYAGFDMAITLLKKKQKEWLKHRK